MKIEIYDFTLWREWAGFLRLALELFFFFILELEACKFEISNADFKYQLCNYPRNYSVHPSHLFEHLDRGFTFRNHRPPPHLETAAEGRCALWSLDCRSPKSTSAVHASKVFLFPARTPPLQSNHGMSTCWWHAIVQASVAIWWRGAWRNHNIWLQMNNAVWFRDSWIFMVVLVPWKHGT